MWLGFESSRVRVCVCVLEGTSSCLRCNGASSSPFNFLSLWGLFPWILRRRVGLRDREHSSLDAILQDRATRHTGMVSPKHGFHHRPEPSQRGPHAGPPRAYYCGYVPLNSLSFSFVFLPYSSCLRVRVFECSSRRKPALSFLNSF